MSYKLSKFQLFKIYCEGRECEKCYFYNCKDCHELFYNYLEDNYEEFKIQNER